MFWVRTNNADNSVSFNNLALIADGLYAGSYFHKSPPRESMILTRIMAIRNELQFRLSNIPQIPFVVL